MATSIAQTGAAIHLVYTNDKEEPVPVTATIANEENKRAVRYAPRLVKSGAHATFTATGPILGSGEDDKITGTVLGPGVNENDSLGYERPGRRNTRFYLQPLGPGFLPTPPALEVTNFATFVQVEE